MIAITSHAGEASGAASVWETLNTISPPRIGHGVRSVEDPALLAYLREQQIHLEVCPSNNVQLNVFSSYQTHSVDSLYRQGVPLSISTDNRTLTPTTLSQEYVKLADSFGWSKADFLRCNVQAVQAAFLPNALKDNLERRLLRAYGTPDL